MKTHLDKAKDKKNDEFYTQLEDIERELHYYTDHLQGKHIFMPCDDAKFSMFWRYFYDNFKGLRLKKISAIGKSFNIFEPSYKYSYEGKDIIKDPLKGDGDFRSYESVCELEKADIIITNPPFSLSREFFALLMKKKKDFLFVCSNLFFTKVETFKYVKSRRVFNGVNQIYYFILPSGEKRNVGSDWITNLQHGQLPSRFWDLDKTFDRDSALYLDNEPDILYVKNSDFVPIDYYGKMAVPATYFRRMDHSKFEYLDLKHDLYLNDKQLFCRIIIKRKNR